MVVGTHQVGGRIRKRAVAVLRASTARCATVAALPIIMAMMTTMLAVGVMTAMLTMSVNDRPEPGGTRFLESRTVPMTHDARRTRCWGSQALRSGALRSFCPDGELWPTMLRMWLGPGPRFA